MWHGVGMPRPLACGSWPSPISAPDTVAGSVSRTSPAVDGSTVWWLEVRPEDGGRSTLVRSEPSGPLAGTDVSLPGQDVRTRFQEYGGAPYSAQDGLALWVDFGTQQVWRAGPGEQPRAVTPPSGGRVRFSCFRLDARRGVAYCLREDQRDPAVEPVTSLVRIDPSGPNDDYGTVVVAGRERPVGTERELPADVDSPPDFVTDPVLSPDGTRIAWVSWNHPRMAWDGTWLRVGALDATGDLLDQRVVAGGEDEAVEQPRWLDDDRLTFLTDRSGWSNHAVVDLAADSSAVPATTPLHHDDQDFGQPRWVPGLSSYDVLPDGRLATGRTVEGALRLTVLDPASGRVSDVDGPWTYLRDLQALDQDTVLAQAFYADRPSALVRIDLRDGTAASLAPTGTAPQPGLVSAPQPRSWPTPDGATAHGFLYPPTHPDVVPLEGERPPLIVTLHGGPTAAAVPSYTAARTFWTSRGFAVLDVNYAGSTGFGRAYRRRLEGAWGVAEVADVAAGVRHLVEAGLVDAERVAITGGSAGGFTTLAALAFTDVFSVGASHYGVGDLSALARDTHKLESRYLWGLVAPWPEGAAVYDERSPVQHVDQLSAPLILLQGSDDKVVPPNQAETMADALRAKGVPVALVVFEGEGHGFRDPAHKVRALEAELSFYGQVLGFEPADDLVPVVVENLAPPRKT